MNTHKINILTQKILLDTVQTVREKLMTVIIIQGIDNVETKSMAVRKTKHS